MRLYKTGHVIANTVSDLIGDLPDGQYEICYGVLRHDLFHDGRWFEVDKGFWNSSHYDGNYRISYKGTQPIYDKSFPGEPHNLKLEPWRHSGDYTLICPPTGHVCDFFNISYSDWLLRATRQVNGIYLIRDKSTNGPIDWPSVSRVITFNSTVGVQALLRGIPVISDPIHSTIGSYQQANNIYFDYDRNPLLNFMQGHQFYLSDKCKIERIIQHYLTKT